MEHLLYMHIYYPACRKQKKLIFLTEYLEEEGRKYLSERELALVLKDIQGKEEIRKGYTDETEKDFLVYMRYLTEERQTEFLFSEFLETDDDFRVCMETIEAYNRKGSVMEEDAYADPFDLEDGIMTLTQEEIEYYRRKAEGNRNVSV